MLGVRARVRRIFAARTAVDAVLAALFCAVELWGIATTSSPALVGDAAEGVSPLTPWVTLWVVAAHVPLLWRQRRPLAALLGSGLLLLAGGLAFDQLVTQGWGVTAAVYEYALAAGWRRSLIATTALYVGGLVAWFPGLVRDDELDVTAYQVFASALFVSFNFYVPWGLGLGVRRLRQSRAREQAAVSDRAVAQERARVARELHDILAHSVSVMVVQAAGAREVLPGNPDRATEALAQIEVTGRQSLVEVRRLLGLLRGTADVPERTPQPGLDDIGDLVTQVRDAGMRVHVALAGERRPLDPSVDLSAYRIVQEALTNVLKHAGPATVAILLDYRRPGVLTLEVVDDGRGVNGHGHVTDGGNGLLGMRERALLAGGGLEAGPRLDGGFRVVATLPLATASPAPAP